MRTVFVINTVDGFLIAADTQAEIHDPDAHTQVMLSSNLEERILHNEKHKLTVISLGPIVFQGVFVKKILANFMKGLNSENRQLTLSKIKSLFEIYIQTNYAEHKEQLLPIFHLVLVTQDKDEIVINKIIFHINYQLLKVKDINVKVNQSLLINEQTSNLNSFVGNVTSDLAKKYIEDEFLKKYNQKRRPLSLVIFSKEGKIEAWERGFNENPFQYLDDYIYAIQNGYFGCDLNEKYCLMDLNKLLPQKNSKLKDNDHLYHDDRIINLQEFSKICRNRISSSENDYFVFYLDTYHFFNTLTLDDPIFKFKFKSIIEKGVIFLLNKSEKPDGSVMAYYEHESRTITIHANLMKEYNYNTQAEIFKHEVQHAYKDYIHQLRWLTYRYTQEENYQRRLESHCTVYFPYNENEKAKWFTLAMIGLERTKKLLNLLSKKSEQIINKDDILLLSKFKSAAVNYISKTINQRLRLLENDALNDPLLQENINSNRGIAYTTTITLHGYRVPYNITYVKIDPIERIAFTKGFTSLKDPLAAALYDLHFTFNLDFQKRVSVTELHAHIMGEYSPALIAVIFPELLKYDYEDSIAALNQPVVEYHSYLSEFAISSKKLSAVDNPVTGKGEAHNELIKRISSIIKLDDSEYEPFMKAVNAREYARALRIACTGTGKVVFELVSILLLFKDKDKLAININEQKGEKKYTALHYAITTNNKDVCNLLTANEADITLLDREFTERLASLQLTKQNSGV